MIKLIRFLLNKKIRIAIAMLLFITLSVFILKPSIILNTKLVDNTLVNLGFSLKEIEIKGIQALTKDEIKNNIAFYKCNNLFCINLKETKRNLKEIGWIKNVNINLALPAKLQIVIKEETPKYIVDHQSYFRLLNSDGKIITKVDTIQEKYKEVLVLAGRKVSERINQLNSIFSHSPTLAKKITQAKLVSDRRWSLIYLSKIIIDLPEREPQIAFKKIQDMDKKYGLLSDKLTKIDLRIKDRMIIKLKTMIFD